MATNSKRAEIAAACVAAWLSAGVVCAQPGGSATSKGTPIAPAKPEAKRPAGVASPATTKPAGTTASKPENGAARAVSAVNVEVVSVLGAVRVRLSQAPDAKWRLLKAGERLSEGVEFFIGPSSSVTIRVAEHQVFVFDQTGKVTLRRALRDGDTHVTRIKVKEGRVGFDVDSTKSKNDVKIECPDMTLAIKGTIGGIEVREGFATRAFGDMENKGRIELDYESGVRAVMTGNETSDANTPNPAENLNEVASVETPKVEARDADEKRQLKRITSSKQDVEFTVGSTKTPATGTMLPPAIDDPGPTPDVPPPASGSVIHLDALNGELFETTPGLDSRLLRGGYVVDPTAATGGSAILNDQTATGAGRLILLETSFPSSGSVRNRLSEVRLDRLHEPASALGSFSGDRAMVPTLSGLGALGPTLYATGSVGDRSGVYRVDMLAGEVAPTMDLGTTFHGALGGSTGRGTLFAVVDDPGGRVNDPLLSRSAIVELDPRTNYMAAAYTGLNGGLGENAGTSNSSGIELASLQALTGLAAVDGGVVISGVSGANGRSVFLRYQTEGGTAQLRDVRNMPEALTHGLASETPGTVGASTPLANPPGLIDRVSLPVLFAEMGYSPQAFHSGLVERLTQRQVVIRASMPEACAASSEIGTLRTYLERHIGEAGGIGRAVADFHASLPSGHPCGQ